MKLKNTLISNWKNVDYIKNFKQFDNVYGILDTSYMIYIAFGMTPYNRSKNFKGNFVYYNMDWMKYRISSWYSVLLLLALVMATTKELENNFDSFSSIINIYLNSQIMIFGIITVNVFAARSKTLLKAYGNSYRADKELKRLGFKLDYKLVHKLALFGSLAIIIFSVMNLIIYLFLGKGILIFIRYSFVYSLPCVIVVIPVYHFFYIGTVALQRLRVINRYLLEDFSLLTEKQIEFNLLYVANIHSEECNAVNNVLLSAAPSILSFYIYTYLQFSTLLLGTFDIIRLNVDVSSIVWNAIYITTTVAILVLATLLNREATKTPYILCELTSAFFDDSIGIRRNTFLLQLLHQRINLRIFGHFKIHLDRVLSDLQAFINLLMFITQFRT